MTTPFRTCSKPGCESRHTARGFCPRHYREFLKSGGARKVVMTRHYGMTPEARFMLYVERPRRGCWEWTGYKNEKGYGVINLGGERMLAHRFSYLRIHESIPEGMFVLHRCDNPACVNVKHLFLGTKADNNADMIAKGRQRMASRVGIANSCAKLTEDQVRHILHSTERCTDLAARYGVSKTNITSIRKRRMWSHIE